MISICQTSSKRSRMRVPLGCFYTSASYSRVFRYLQDKLVSIYYFFWIISSGRDLSPRSVALRPKGLLGSPPKFLSSVLSNGVPCPRLKRISILIPIPRLCLAASTNQSPSCNWKRQRPVQLEDSRLNCRRNTIYGSERSRAKREERKGRLSRQTRAAASWYNFDIPSLSEGRYANDL